MHPPAHSPQIGAATLLLAELTAGAGGGQLAHALAVIPPWLGGALSALAVGAVLRVLDPACARFERAAYSATPDVGCWTALP